MANMLTVPATEPNAGRISRWLNQPYLIVTGLFIFCVLVFTATLMVPRVDGLLVGSDGTSYFANLHSLVFDHDLDLRNDLLQLTGETPPGAEIPKYSIGLPLLWLPFYLTAHLIASLLHLLGLSVSTDGYSWLYQYAVCFGTMFYGYIGLLLMVRLCREFVRPALALLAVFLVWFGWNLFYYLVLENSMPHLTSMAVVAGLISWWRFERQRTFWLYWGVLGLLGGLAAAVRPQDGAFLLILGLDLLWQFSRAVRLRSGPAIGRQVGAGLLVLAGSLLSYLPQMLVAWRYYGQPFTSGYLVKGETFNWFSPEVLATLFSTRHGLLTCHPLILLAIVGWWWLAQRDRSYTLILVAAVVAQLYIIAAWHEWWQGDAFGGRMFISCAPVFALGLAALLEYLYKRAGWWPLALIALPAVAWNTLFVLQYRLGFVSKVDGLTLREMTLGKVTVVYDLVKRILHKS